MCSKYPVAGEFGWEGPEKSFGSGRAGIAIRQFLCGGIHGDFGYGNGPQIVGESESVRARKQLRLDGESIEIGGGTIGGEAGAVAGQTTLRIQFL